MKRLPSNFKSPPTWDSFAAMALRGKGKIALLGTTDAGKSTLATFLLRTVLTAGKTAAFLDTDLGQTSEGLPGTLNLTIFSAAGKTVRRYSHFVGAFSPAGHFTEVLAGISLLLSVWTKRPTDFLIADTSGFILGEAAIRLKYAKLSLISPQWVVALQEGAELEPLLREIQFWRGTKIQRFPMAVGVRRRTREMRQQYRQKKLARYFRHAKQYEWPAAHTVFLNTWLGSGTALSREEIRWLGEKLATQVFYGEKTRNGLFLLTDTSPAPANGLSAARAWNTLNLHVTPFSEWQNLLVGLLGGNRLTLGLGQVTGFQSERTCLQIATPLRSVEKIRAVHWGSVRFDPASPAVFSQSKA